MERQNQTHIGKNSGVVELQFLENKYLHDNNKPDEGSTDRIALSEQWDTFSRDPFYYILLNFLIYLVVSYNFKLTKTKRKPYLSSRW